jgi:branched-chain amino acid aminotransferase
MSLSQRTVWHNGDLVPESEAKLSIYDSALMMGDMVFEMTRSFNKVHFKLREHLKRLYASAKYVHIDMPMSIDDLFDAVQLTTEVNHD